MQSDMKTYRRVLSIAGSDSGGAAGIQADLKAISACGCYAMTAVTAITAQNTKGVTDIHPVPAKTVEAQIRAVLDDIGVDAVKIGMLHSSEIIRLVVGLLKEYGIRKIVADPVMVTTSGDKLLQDEAIRALCEELLPLATVITPNLFEAEIITGMEIKTQEAVDEAVRKMKSTRAGSALLKAGHLETDPFYDVLYDFTENKEYRFETSRISTPNTNGTGCTFASAIAAFLAQNDPLEVAVRKAHAYLHESIRKGAEYKIGNGHGNVHHFYEWWS